VREYGFPKILIRIRYNPTNYMLELFIMSGKHKWVIKPKILWLFLNNLEFIVFFWGVGVSQLFLKNPLVEHIQQSSVESSISLVSPKKLPE
jgi:hypothetical protein